jgi:hypothetical protein
VVIVAPSSRAAAEHTARAYVARVWSNEAAARAYTPRPHQTLRYLHQTAPQGQRTTRSPGRVMQAGVLVKGGPANAVSSGA